ncbi:hypothetical protein OFY05_03820 [Pseudocitrobacter faecalis]|nr:hypothetical protein OFY05_03820 [Pseudocitrobacter faecalis]
MPGGDIRWLKASYQSNYGNIGVHWQRDGEKMLTLSVVIPPNTRADVVLEGAERVLNDDGVAFVACTEGVRAALGSGRYTFTYLLA